MRTIPGIEQQLKRIDHVITSEFIPAITNGINCSTNLRKLMALPPKLGGLGIPIFTEMAEGEFDNSTRLTTHLVNNIINQEKQLHHEQDTEKIKREMKSIKA